MKWSQHYNAETEKVMNKKCQFCLICLKAAKFVQEHLEFASSSVSDFKGPFIHTIKHRTTFDAIIRLFLPL